MNIKKLKKDKYFQFLCISIFISIILLFFTGKFEAKIVPDTYGYIPETYYKFSDLWNNARSPFFWLILKLFFLDSNNFFFYPLFSISLYYFSVLFLYYSQKVYGLSNVISLSIPLGLVFSNPLILYSNYVHPELLSISLILISLSLTILLSKFKGGAKILLFIMLSSGLAYLLKPMLLFFIISLPFLFYIITKKTKSSRNLTFILLCFTILPFFIVSSFRLIIVKDFNISSFGGFQMSAIAALMIDEKTIEKLPSNEKQIGMFILNSKSSLINENLLLPIPLNSQNKRSFVSTTLGYYDVLARNYDTVLNEVMLKLKNPEDDWISYNNNMQKFTLSVIIDNPIYYSTWIIGGSIRFVGRVFIANLSFMVSFLALILIFLHKNIFYNKKINKNILNIIDHDFFILFIICFIYTFSIGIICILLTFPAARYIDSAGITLAGLPIYFIIKFINNIYRNKNV